MTWRCAASSVVLAALCGAAAAQPLTRGPYLVDASSVSAKVCWRQGSGDDYCRQIAGIPAGAAFAYRLPGIRSSWTAKTLSPYWDPTRFAVFGDAGDGSAAQTRVARVLGTVDAQFVLLTGDVVYPDGADAAYDARYFKVYQPALSSIAFFPAVGNHDYGNAWFSWSGRRRFNEGYRRVFQKPPYYSFDAGPVHIASIDTNQADRIAAAARIGRGSAQLAWLESDLAQSSAPWKIVFMHVPLYATSRGHGDNAWLREALQPALERGGASLAFAGHEHLYQRSKPIRGVTYITVGTGGAGLSRPNGPADWLAREVVAHGLLVVDASETALRSVFYDDDGKPRDDLTLTRSDAEAKAAP